MLRKYLIIGGLVSLVIVLLVLVGAFVQQPSAASASVASSPELAPPDAPEAQIGGTNGMYLWSFAAKFVCGYQPKLTGNSASVGEPVVVPGNYATEINIHNPNYRLNMLWKKYILLVDAGKQLIVREPQQMPSTFMYTMTLGVNSGTMDDCNALYQTVNPAGGVPITMPLTIGYLVVLSPLDLNMDVVYSANAPGGALTVPSGISEDVLHVLGKRVFIPAGQLP